jgi:2-hydroxychromene-2-carboxylate isomerase
MTRTIEFWCDFGSPTTDLAHMQRPLLAREMGTQRVDKPIRPGGVFKVTCNASPVSGSPRGAG